MLVQTRNEKSSEYQTTMSFYLLACGATRSQFEVLNHAGICLSYRSTLRKVKDLGQERLAAVRKIAHERMFMLIWDNLNFAFRVGQQRLGSNDHFDNGTTAVLSSFFGDLLSVTSPSKFYRLEKRACLCWNSLLTISCHLWRMCNSWRHSIGGTLKIYLFRPTPFFERVSRTRFPSLPASS
jgi:hypothetical protein